MGHAYSALLASDMAQTCDGEFLLRIEDIDQSRARPQWEDLISEDLLWLGLNWQKPVLRQSDRLGVYRAALTRLWHDGLLFACTCTRRDIAEALSAPQEGATPVLGPDGLIYPGTCRHRKVSAHNPALPTDVVLRLDVSAAVSRLNRQSLTFAETGAGPEGETGKIVIPVQDVIESVGDVVLARRDMGTSYHLSVVLDDAEQQITDIVRGADLFEATSIHVLLQDLLGLPTPRYHHHRLIRDETGKRLAKRDDARAISLYRAEGKTPQDIRNMVGL